MANRYAQYLNLLLWICFLFFDILIACSIAEIWTRLFIPVQNICYNHDPELGDMRCPNQKTYGYVEKGYSNILLTNSEGFHDIERSKQKNQNTLRIHIYGDSLISGVGVPIDKTIPSLIETYLNKFSFPIPIESLNVATAEDSTCAQLLAYRLIGRKYSPDVVICYFMCDFRDNIFETHQRTRSPYFTLSSDNNLVFVPPVPVDLTTPVERLKRSSLLVRLFANKLLASKFYQDIQGIKDSISSGQLLKKKEKSSTYGDVSGLVDAKLRTEKLLTEKAWPLTILLLQEFKREAEKDGAFFVLVDGKRFTPNTAGKYTNQDLKQFCIGNKILYIPIYEEYEALKTDDNPDKNYFLKDGHPTAMGNEMLSRMLTDKLATKLNEALRGEWKNYDQQ